LGTGLLFSCSDSKDDPWIHPVPYPKTITKEIFNVKDLFPKFQVGDSLVLVSKNPFNIEDLQYADVTMSRSYGYENDAPIWNDSVFDYQKIRLDWLTLVHPTDSTLILKADGNYNPKPIVIYVESWKNALQMCATLILNFCCFIILQ
jgi:hypothetical protein